MALLAFGPMEQLAMDFLKLSCGHGGLKDVLMMADAFKYALAVSCRNQMAVIVAMVLPDH